MNAPIRAYIPAITPDNPLRERNLDERSIRDLIEDSSECISFSSI
jgi:hypothetical protein